MGARKKEMADRLKEERKNVAFAKLNSFPTSPRKMRLVDRRFEYIEIHT
jgi:large subunit ribosomal protein L22